MIIAKLMGGMGNQMFEYAAARRLAKQHRTDLKLDVSVFKDRTPRKSFVYRDFDLDVFNIDGEIAKPHDIKPYLSIPMKVFRRFLRGRFMRRKYIREEHHHFDTRIINAPDNVYLDGYWQSEKYFIDIEYTIRKDFSFKYALDKRCEEMAKEIESSNAICVNVRRGDFVNNKFLGVIGLEYYHKCASIIATKMKNIHYFIFSDDMEWCVRNMNFSDNFTFVGHEYAGRKFDHYLHLMSLCKHFVIPNSTFAWWAAWLCRNKEKLVFAPNKWFADISINTKDIIPEGWIRI